MKNQTVRRGTRDKILDGAQRLMLDKGFAATSLSEICEAAGITKGSFFHYFDTKETLGRAVLLHYWQPMKNMHDQGDYLSISDPRDRLLRYCDFITELLEHPATPKSCLFGNFSQELSTTHPEIVAVCQEAFTWWTAILEHDLTEARKNYAPAKDFDPKSLAQHFIAVYEGSLILFKTYRDPSVFRRQMSHFKDYLTLLFERSERKTHVQIRRTS